MASTHSQYAKLISNLTKEQFDSVVVAFIESYWELDNLVLTDGKGDGGIDFKIFENKARIKVPIQVTIEKKLEKKVNEDLVKIQKLIVERGFSNELYFFCSHTLEEKKQIELEENARTQFGINLVFATPRFIVANLGKVRYKKLRTTIRKFYPEILDNSEAIFTSEEKLKFDLILYGRETTEIKNKIFDSFLLLEIFKKGSIEISEIESAANKQFRSLNSNLLCKREIHKLKESGKISLSGLNNSVVSLTKEEISRIESTLEEIDLEEGELIDSVRTVLEPYRLESFTHEIIGQLKLLFQNLHYKDIDEIAGRITSSSDYSVVKDFMKFISQKEKNEKNCKIIAIDLINLCKENDFIQRVSAGDLFTKLIDEPELETYLNITKRVVYLDTPVALHLICVLYKETNSFKNIYYKSALDFWRFMKNSGAHIEVKISKDYVQEIAYHINEALRMIELYKYNFFLKLGSSNNVFLNFYEDLKSSSELDDSIASFSDFLIDFGFKNDAISDTRLISFLTEKIELFFNSNSIKVFQTEDYTSKPIYIELKREIEFGLLERSEARPQETIKRDILMTCYLYDENKHGSVDPFFITWDSIFYELRRKYHSNHPQAQFWHLFRPAKFLDHFALVSLKLDSKSITQDILLVIEMEFKLKTKVFNLKDTIAKVLDLKSSSAIKFVQEIAEIRENEIFRLKERPSPNSDPDFVEQTSVEFLMSDIFNYFKSSVGPYNLQDLKECTSESSNLELLIKYLRKEIDYYSKKGKWDSQIHNNLNTIIRWHKQNLNSTSKTPK